MSEMIERVARAIHEAMDITDGLDGTAAERYARAALLAMEYPTESMIKAAHEELAAQQVDSSPPHPPERVPYIVWRGMIEAAISP